MAALHFVRVSWTKLTGAPASPQSSVLACRQPRHSPGLSKGRLLGPAGGWDDGPRAGDPGQQTVGSMGRFGRVFPDGQRLRGALSLAIANRESGTLRRVRHVANSMFTPQREPHQAVNGSSAG